MAIKAPGPPLWAIEAEPLAKVTVVPKPVATDKAVLPSAGMLMICGVPSIAPALVRMVTVALTLEFVVLAISMKALSALLMLTNHQGENKVVSLIRNLKVCVPDPKSKTWTKLSSLKPAI